MSPKIFSYGTPPKRKKVALGGLVDDGDFSLNFSAESSAPEDSWVQAPSVASPRRVHDVNRSLSRFLDLKKYGRLSGFELVGFLNNTADLVKDDCPQNQHTPIYWVIPETEQWFCFSQAALHEASAKDAILSVDEWRQLVQAFSKNWRFLGFVHDS